MIILLNSSSIAQSIYGYSEPLLGGIIPYDSQITTRRNRAGQCLPLTIVGQTNIDTGAYNSYNYATLPYAANQIAPFDWAGLTCVELDSWSFYQATETTFKTIDPVVISREDLDDFGSKNG